MKTKALLIAAILVVIAAVLVFGAVGSAAWFSSESNVVGNTLTAGRLEIDVRGEGGTSLPISVTNMEPGTWSDPYQLGVFNTPTSTMECKYAFNAENPSDPTLAGLINVRVRHTFAGTPDPGSWPIVWEGSLYAFQTEFRSTDTHGNPIVNGGVLPVNNTHVYVLQFQLDPSADNTWQGATETFDLAFRALQVGAPW